MLNEFPYDECPHCKTKSLMVEWGQTKPYYAGSGIYREQEPFEIAHCTNCNYTDQDFLEYTRDYCEWPLVERKLPEIEWKTNDTGDDGTLHAV